MYEDDEEKDDILYLKDQLENLREHWGGGSKMSSKLSADSSDILYKHHLANMMNIYGSEDGTGLVDTKVDMDRLRPKKSTPLQQLYGFKGLLARNENDPKIKKQIKKKEDGWDIYTGSAKLLSPDLRSFHPITQIPKSSGNPGNGSESFGLEKKTKVV